MTERVTVTLPSELVRDIDRLERNRSRFMQSAVRHEIERRRRDLLRESLQAPHPEAGDLAEAGLLQWAAGLPDEDAAGLVDSRSGRAIRWSAGTGWTAVQE